MFDSIHQNQSIGRINYPQNFRGNSSVVTNPNLTYPNDTVEIQGEVKTGKKKKGMSKAGKWALGIGGTLASFAAAGMLIMRHDSQKLAKLCKDKIKFSELPENLEYNAKTKEEAIKFAKEVLGIKEIDEGFTEEALHWVNRGIVDVSNANKGRVFIPPKLAFIDYGKEALASADLAIKTDRFGMLTINKNYFDNEFLTKELKRQLALDTEATEKIAEVSKETLKNNNEKIDIKYVFSDRFNELYTKLKQSSDTMTIAEKRELCFMMQESAVERQKYTKTQPILLLKTFAERLKQAGIEYDYEAISKLPLKEQRIKVAEINNQFIKNTGKYFGVLTKMTNVNKTIYHEMGHLQDFAENLEKLSLKDTDWARFKRAFKNKHKNIEVNNHDEFEAVGSRWLKIEDFDKDGKTGLELLKESSERFKTCLPDLYEHVTNPETQKIAGEISAYAQQGVGEFIAEVYAEMIHGTKLSDKVIELYKKYNGPIPANYVL